MSAGSWVQVVINGLMLAAVYGLIALGLTVVFSLLDIVNFAQGQLLVLGGYLTFELVSGGLNYWLALLLVVVAVSVLGFAIDATLFARVRDRPINGLLISIGLISIFDTVFHKVWGPDPQFLPAPVRTVITIGDVRVAASRILLVAATVLVLVALGWFLRRARLGKALRATGELPEAAALMGIPIQRVRSLSFSTGAGLAAIAGALLAAVFPIDPQAGANYLVKAFIVLILGGLGSPVGTILGAVLLGLVESVGITVWSSGTADLLSFVLMIVVLYTMPRGLIPVSREVTL